MGEHPILVVCEQPMKWHPILRCFQHPMNSFNCSVQRNIKGCFVHKEQWSEFLQLFKKDHNFSFIWEPRGALGSLQNCSQDSTNA